MRRVNLAGCVCWPRRQGDRKAILTVDRRAIDFVYDFSISSHVDQFRRECEAAWKYIERHIYMMAEAKNELGRRGLWFGANMPTGYIPDRREEIDGRENPDYRKIFPTGLTARK
ncbi:MAG TPA: hypothetical protein VFA09_25040 [Ktedonobacteraceae bacterium]|nr:hypothetical protein [Ktedonobacteraceae bacterium]